MFEMKIHTVRKYGLTINDEDVYFSSKGKAIEAGKISIKLNPNTKLFEEYKLWDITHDKPCLIDKQRFDRTILIL